MAERRRRRRNSSNTESELSEGEEGSPSKLDKSPIKASDCESELTHGEETSEYDSATEGADDDEETETEEESTEDEEEPDVIVEGYQEGADWIEEERQSGDGEEQPDKNKELDDDEDKKNPAYIPRKGAFYEHDTRLGEDPPEEAPPEKEEKPGKKLWREHDKWDHSKFNQDQQAPKSRDEIIAIYGYDIRAHNKPPDGILRGNNRNRRPERSSQLSDYMPESGGGDGYQGNQGGDRPYRGRGGGRGGPRGRGSPRGGRGGYQDSYNPRFQQRTESQDVRLSSENQDQEYRYQNNRPNQDFRPSQDSRQNPSQDYRQNERFDNRRYDNQGYNRRNEGQEPNNRAYTDYKNNRNQDDTRPIRTNARGGFNNSNYNQRQWNNTKRDDAGFRAENENIRKTITPERDHDKILVGTKSVPDVVPASLVEVYNVQNVQESDPNETKFRKPERDYRRENEEDHGDSKSYSRDRRNKVGRTRIQDNYNRGQEIQQPEQHPQRSRHEDNSSNQRPPDVSANQRQAPRDVSANQDKATANVRQSKPAVTVPSLMSIYPPVTSHTTSPGAQQPPPKTNFPPPPKAPDMSQLQGQGRTKRYSTQRQRPTPESEASITTQTPPPVSIAGPRSQFPRPSVARNPPPVGGQVQGFFSNQIYARPPVVFPHPTQSNNPQSPPHTIPFTQPTILQSLPSGPYSIAATSHVQTSPRLHILPPLTTSLATATMNPVVAANIPPSVRQPLQGPFVAAPVINYGPPGPQGAPQGPPTHFQMAGHIPIQYPPVQPQQIQPSTPLNQGPEPIHIHGGTTYFSAEAPAFRPGITYFPPQVQQPAQALTNAKRQKAAIPIINPQDLRAEASSFEYIEGGEQYEYPTDVDGMQYQYLPTEGVHFEGADAALYGEQGQPEEGYYTEEQGQSIEQEPELGYNEEQSDEFVNDYQQQLVDSQLTDSHVTESHITQCDSYDVSDSHAVDSHVSDSHSPSNIEEQVKIASDDSELSENIPSITTDHPPQPGESTDTSAEQQQTSEMCKNFEQLEITPSHASSEIQNDYKVESANNTGNDEIDSLTLENKEESCIEPQEHLSSQADEKEQVSNNDHIVEDSTNASELESISEPGNVSQNTEETVANQSKEKMMTEIKLVYTEAKGDDNNEGDDNKS